MAALEGLTVANLPIHTCRSCGHQPIISVLDLGKMPLANALLFEKPSAEFTEEKFPLALFFCPSCTLVQIGESVPPDKLFGHYLYASSFSDTMLNHSQRLVQRLISDRALTPDHRVIEIASNDGYLLQFYQKQGVEVLGIEPAVNIAKISEERGIPTVVEFFGPDLAERLASEGCFADVVHAHNVFAHVPDPNGFVAGLKKILKPLGVAIIEAPYVGELIEKLEFDTIYHEHFSYFSLTAVDGLLKRHGLMLSDVEFVSIHGGSFRLFVSHEGAASSPRIAATLALESAKGMTEAAYYRNFAQRVWMLRDELKRLLHSLKSEGKTIAAYGASAKGSTLMNAFGIDAGLIDFVVDRSTLKQGRFTPGNYLQILPPEALLDRGADYALLLTWNFAEEIFRQQDEYIKSGGHFIIPLPSLRVM